MTESGRNPAAHFKRLELFRRRDHVTYAPDYIPISTSVADAALAITAALASERCPSMLYHGGLSGYLLPSTFAFSLTAEGQSMYPKFAAFCRWRERMDNLPATQKVRAAVPRVPIEHAREWANSHRPRY